jgi:DNA-binding transcriptional regulator GbsR (MarR family)
MDRAASDGELRFIEDFALVMTEAGVPRMPARVFACVLADDEGRVTAGELARRLRVSPAAISGAVRYLVQARMLQKGREPGSRTDHYFLGDDLWYAAITNRTELLERWEQSMAEGAGLLGDRPAARRLRESQAFFAFLREELPELMERWHVRRTELEV